MSKKKYYSDYQLETDVDNRGRLRTNARYVGDRYDFAVDEPAVKAHRRVFTVFCAVAWIAFIAALIPPTAAMHLAYCSVPFAFSALPLWLISENTVRLYTVKRPFDRRISDKFTKKLNVYTVLLLVMSAGSAVGYTVGLIVHRSEFTAVDSIPAASVLLMLASAVVFFTKRNAFPVRVAVRGKKRENASSTEKQTGEKD